MKNSDMKIRLAILTIIFSFSTFAQAEIATFNFDDGTLQGWINSGSEDYKPWNTDDNNNGGRTVARSDAIILLEDNFDDRDASDSYVKILSSPKFLIDGSSAIEIYTLGGVGSVATPEWSNIADLPSIAGADFMGAALRRVSDGQYLLFSRRSDSGQSNRDINWLPIGWTEEEIAIAVEGDTANEKYVVDIIDTYSGGWGWIGIDDITMTDVTIVGDNPVAIEPAPFNFETEVPMSTTILDWDVFNTQSPTYDIYFGTDPSGQQWLESDAGLSATEYSISTTLTSDTTYYWRVDVHEAGDPNIYTGNLWSFETEKELPQITIAPKNTFAYIGESAKFEVEATNPIDGPLSYQWFTGSLESGVIIDGETSPTLTIASVTEDNYSTLYYCSVSNNQGSSYTEPISIIEKIMLAYWPMENLADPNSIVEGTPDTSTNGEPSLTDGIVGKAFLFDGEDDFLYVPESADYFDSMYKNCSVTCWIKSNIMERWSPFVSKHGESGEGWQLRQYTSNGTATFTTRGTDNEDGISTGTTINDGQWHYIVGTFDGTNKKVFVDGLEVFSLEVSGTITPSDKAVSIATEITGTDYSYGGVFQGVIDEVKLFNYAMNSHEIGQNYADISGNSICPEYSNADLDHDCDVDIIDFSILAESWLIDNTISPK